MLVLGAIFGLGVSLQHAGIGAAILLLIGVWLFEYGLRSFIVVTASAGIAALMYSLWELAAHTQKLNLALL
jgi:hypothetical protein